MSLLGGGSKPPPPASPTIIDSPNIQKDDLLSADFWMQPLHDALAELDDAPTLAPGNHDFMVGKIEKAKRARVLFRSL
jgi:hypothetical protein